MPLSNSPLEPLASPENSQVHLGQTFSAASVPSSHSANEGQLDQRVASMDARLNHISDKLDIVIRMLEQLKRP